jgi:hypothetical protein
MKKIFTIFSLIFVLSFCAYSPVAAMSDPTPDAVYLDEFPDSLLIAIQAQSLIEVAPAVKAMEKEVRSSSLLKSINKDKSQKAADADTWAWLEEAMSAYYAVWLSTMTIF